MFAVPPSRPRANPNRRTGGAVNFSIDVADIAGIADVYRALPMAIRVKITEPIVRKLAQMGAKEAAMNVTRVLPKRNPKTRRWDRPTGALRDSMGFRILQRSKMRNKFIVWGAFGARMDFRVNRATARNVANNRQRITANINGITTRVQGPIPIGRVRAFGRTILGVQAIQPAKYAHLVEEGHKGSPAHRIPAAVPHRFMAPARQAIAARMPGLVSKEFNSTAQRVFASEIRRAQRPGRVTGYRSSMNARR
jgi:hypothetical protein